ncbi:HD domain-containing protein [Allorhizocola rhizosphaerae]|uniref:HD domain-containing protein n=1 Tax=Allorhizocola rhizosphaerae TaxID=1872709 RepID=UPI001FE90766|nr:HD domain-containing protein [Allorhizocola rhizosphaerae]
MNRALLDRALTGAAQVRPLPDDVAALLREVSAPPRLAAHLRAVHDVAWQLVAAIANLCPALRFDREEVLFGAATHDIGKTIHPNELSQPGTRHEQAGYALLVESGVEHRLARFAANHGTWTAPGISTEDLLVSLADKIWKAKRIPDLEDRLIQRICDMTGEKHWEVFMNLDDLLDRLAQGADARLEFQNQYPVAANG